MGIEPPAVSSLAPTSGTVNYNLDSGQDILYTICTTLSQAAKWLPNSGNQPNPAASLSMAFLVLCQATMSIGIRLCDVTFIYRQEKRWVALRTHGDRNSDLG